jgi:ketosteroid isomerase-like protein
MFQFAKALVLNRLISRRGENPMRLKFALLLTSCMTVVLFVALVTNSTSHVSAADDRAADREAIRAHIEKIFKAYIEGDCNTIRMTHSENWIGFTGQARSIIRGLDDYMKNSARFCEQNSSRGPRSLSGYKLAEIDYTFFGDVALVPYVAETSYGKDSVPGSQGKLRALDIYAKLGNEWIQVGSNIGPHPDTVRAQVQQLRQLTPPERQTLLAAREAVWRAFFSGDQALLEKLIPEEALVIGGPEQEAIGNRANILAAAKKFSEQGSKVVRLEFPRTEMQNYGDTAIVYTTYLIELQNAQGERRTQTGRGTEFFVRRNDTWLNTGWHLQRDK